MKSNIGRVTTPAAAELLGLERRQVQRLAKAYQEHGATALISKKRGRPSNRKTPDDVRLAAMAIVKERYADFGPTLAAEKLREQHGLTISRETLRVWMLDAGLWADRPKRRARVYQPRYRRDCVGELVQVDGSEHYWFEDRGPSCSLLVFIDDATSRLIHLQFVQSAFTFAYFNATQRYLDQTAIASIARRADHDCASLQLGGEGAFAPPQSGACEAEARQHQRPGGRLGDAQIVAYGLEFDDFRGEPGQAQR